jgi:hypothetical protein
MANLSLVRVNQKLAQAMVMLERVKQATANASEALWVNAARESIAFHLMCAYQHYLREIAETYFIKHPGSITTEADLVLAFQAAKKHPAEVNELLALRQAPDSWLHQLHVYYESLWRVSAPANLTSLPTGSPKTSLPENLIELVNVEQEVKNEQVEVGVMFTWHQAFVALVMRQRQTSAEF